MLYKYLGNERIEMLPSYDFEDFGGVEKDLENLLANNLSDLYSENSQLMPIFQERSRQPEPDLCALDKDGNLVIFELKRGTVLGDTTIQVMRYCQDYGQKNYFELADMYKKYSGDSNLCEAHKEAFGLEKPLNIEEFNRKQKLVIVGCSSDSHLMDAVDYWQQKGIDIDFIPYRFYKINGECFFEFFAKPYDYHIGISDCKGIIFDTNRKYVPEGIWDMFANNKVSAYGNVRTCINALKKGDYVLYYHAGYGIVGAGKVKSSKTSETINKEEMYVEVELLTPNVQCEEDLRYITVSELRELLNKNFYFARTTKRPYLSEEEARKVVDLLKQKYEISAK